MPWIADIMLTNWKKTRTGGHHSSWIIPAIQRSALASKGEDIGDAAVKRKACISADELHNEIGKENGHRCRCALLTAHSEGLFFSVRRFQKNNQHFGFAL
jgi:hypothetical protein